MDILIFWCLGIKFDDRNDLLGCFQIVWLLQLTWAEHSENPHKTSQHLRHPWISLRYPLTPPQTPPRHIQTIQDAYRYQQTPTDVNRHQQTSTDTAWHTQTAPGSVCCCLLMSVGLFWCLLASLGILCCLYMSGWCLLGVWGYLSMFLGVWGHQMSDGGYLSAQSM